MNKRLSIVCLSTLFAILPASADSGNSFSTIGPSRDSGHQYGENVFRPVVGRSSGNKTVAQTPSAYAESGSGSSRASTPTAFASSGGGSSVASTPTAFASSGVGSSVASTPTAFASSGGSASAESSPLSELVKKDQQRGRSSLNDMAKEFLLKNPEVKYLGKPEWGGSDIRDKDGRPLPGYVNPARVKGASPLGTVFPPTPANAMGWQTESKVTEGMYYQMLSGLDGFNGWQNSDLKEFSQKIQSGNLVAKTVQYPLNAADEARADFTAQLTALGNAAGDVAKEQAASAIEYCAKYMENFTAQPGSKWNQIRDSLFVPIGLLLLLPGAILSQIRAMVGLNVPLSLTQTNPFDGLLRSVIAVFLIPATYLVVNYAIDFSNSITFTLASEYVRITSSDMYQDAVCSEIRAFPVRGPKENQNAGIAQSWPQVETTSIPRLEKNLYQSKTDDPCSGTYSAPESRTDEGMPLASVFGRLLAFGGNALLTSAWNVLCAFQMAYMLYLFWVGPVVAGLWVWPVKQFRDALPNWVEGVITLAFWSLFWNTAILLMACFKGMADTGTVYETALNFLATGCVKYAFDFVGLIKAAGQEASKATGVAGSSGRPGEGEESSPPAARSSGASPSRASNTSSSPAPISTLSDDGDPVVSDVGLQLNSANLQASRKRSAVVTSPVLVPEEDPWLESAEISGSEKLGSQMVDFRPETLPPSVTHERLTPENSPPSVMVPDWISVNNSPVSDFYVSPPPGEIPSGEVINTVAQESDMWLNSMSELSNYEPVEQRSVGRLMNALGQATDGSLSNARRVPINQSSVW